MRIVESDETLGDWAPEPWHKEQATKGKPAKRKWEVPAGCEEMPQALGRVPPAVEGPQFVVMIAKASRGRPRETAERLAGTRRKAAAVVERRKARLARGREKARLLSRSVRINLCQLVSTCINRLVRSPTSPHWPCQGYRRLLQPELA